jgi:hypothetical protein
MAKPIATAENIAFAFPNVCNTVVGPSTVPIPYPSIADLSAAKPVSDEGNGLFVKGKPVLLENSEVETTSGDEAADGSANSGACTMTQASASVFYGGQGLVRFSDTTSQNDGVASGTVLSAEPSVLVGD